MRKIPDLRETPPPPDEVVQAGLDGNLVLFVGAGASRLLGLPSWAGLADLALQDLRKATLLNYSEIEQLKTLDPKKQLSIATLIAAENSIDLNLEKHLKQQPKDDNIYRAINDIGCSCVTTNYDELLAPRLFKTKDGSETPSGATRTASRDQFFSHLLNEPGTVIHLHGCISQPETMIVTTKDYLEHYDNQNVQEFLGDMFARKTIVFLGYGLEEAEILEHILRRGGAKESQEKRRFTIQGFFYSEDPLYRQLYDYYEKSFGVHIIGFIRDHENYKALEGTIKSWVSQIKIRETPLSDDLKLMNEVLGV